MKDLNLFNVESFINDSGVLNIYVFGSYLYGTATENSDIDYIIIVKDDFWFDGENIKIGKNDFNFYTESNWKYRCDTCHINALEVMSITDPKFILKETIKFEVSKGLIKLRQSVSAVVSNSWAKANKKLNVEKDFDPFIAKKSLWHCFRMLNYGIQICKFGIITDFTSMNHLYNEIVNNESNDWKSYKLKYQEQLNSMRTQFRLYMEKEWIEFKKEIEND